MILIHENCFELSFGGYTKLHVMVCNEFDQAGSQITGEVLHGCNLHLLVTVIPDK